MYKVLIVDDEAIEREGIRLLIEQNHSEFSCIMEAENGYEAIDIYRDNKPDLVIMDIGMPGINGIDTIRELRKMGGMAKYIILTAHSQFKYAQEAIRIGVTDFLIKPTNLKHFKTLLDRIGEELASERQRTSDHRIYQEKVDHLNEVIEADCLYSVVMEDRSYGLEDLLQYYDNHYIAGMIYVVRDAVGSDMIPLLRGKLSDKVPRFIGRNIMGINVVMCLYTQALRWSDIQDMIEYMELILGIYAEDGYHIGYDSKVTDLDQMRTGYIHALEAVRACSLPVEVKEYNRINLNPETVTYDYIQYTDRFFEAIETDNKQIIDELETSMLKDLYVHYSGELKRIQAYLLEVVTLLRKMVYDYTGAKLSYEPTDMRLTSQVIDYDELEKGFGHELTGIVATFRRSRETNQDRLAASAYAYIQTNYASNISLDTLAEHMAISTYYACKIIKKAYDKSFVELLTAFRIRRAKVLLRESNLSVKEVSYETGYNSQNYFTKIFKKHIGMTPSEYRSK